MLSFLLLDLLDVGGLQSLGTLHNVEGDALAFLERLETLRLDRGKMYEYIFAVLLLQETKPLAVIEPLYGTSWHVTYPKKIKKVGSRPTRGSLSRQGDYEPKYRCKTDDCWRKSLP